MSNLSQRETANHPLLLGIKTESSWSHELLASLVWVMHGIPSLQKEIVGLFSFDSHVSLFNTKSMFFYHYCVNFLHELRNIPMALRSISSKVTKQSTAFQD